MEKFIKGWDKKYSINDKGEVWANYKYNNQGKKFYKRLLLMPQIHVKGTNCLAVHFGTQAVGKKLCKKAVFVKTLMQDYFKLNPPDKHHRYDLVNKDGDIYNNQVSNLGWRIHMSTPWKHYPQPFYDKKGKIIEKICGNCGSRLDIKCFSLQNHQKYKKVSQHDTYRNECTHCRSTKRWKQVKSDPKLLNRHKEVCAKYIPSEKIKKKTLETARNLRRSLDPKYIKQVIAAHSDLRVADVTPQMIEIQTKAIVIARKINNRKIK